MNIIITGTSSLKFILILASGYHMENFPHAYFHSSITSFHIFLEELACNFISIKTDKKMAM